MAELSPEEAIAVAEAIPEFTEAMVGFSKGFVALASAASAAGAALTAYFIADRRLRAKYEQIAEEEISQMREHFHAKAVAMEEKPALDGLVTDLGYVPAAGETKPEPGAPNTTVEIERETPNHTAIEPTEMNVFDEAQARLQEKDAAEGWDYDTERSKRVAGKPYIIHRDEQEEMGLTQSTFTYYEGDDVLCDERDRVVDSRDEILGTEFVDKFGHGSDDPNVVYIRNEELGVEIEVCKSPNSYAEEVHGFKHSDPPPRAVRRMSLEDE